MENLSKALLIAAGMLIAVMIILLIVGAWSQISGYFTEEHNSKMVEQTLEFNNKFENYNGKTIRGNELISIINRIIDYNNYKADIEKYERVKININLKGHAGEFAYDGNANLFPNDPIENNSNDTEIRRISELSSNLTSSASGIPKITDTKLQKLSSEIHNIVDADKYTGNKKEEYIKKRQQKIKNILGYEVKSDETELMNNIIDATKKYYQLTQFKRATFNCTGVIYNTSNGRVNGMTFVINETSEGKVIFE